MRTLNVTYSTIKNILSTYPSYYIQQGDGGYHLFVVGDESFIRSSILGVDESSVIDFETYYKSKSTSVASADDAKVLGDIANSNPLTAPRTSDGKNIVMPSFFPGGVYFYVTGAGDVVDTSPPTRGNGTLFQISSDNQAGETLTSDFQFCDWVYLSGGGILSEGAAVGDHVSMKLYCPATAVTPNNTHTGNCNVVYGVIVPAAGNGLYDVNLSAANPVPAYSDVSAPSGYWDWSEPDTGFGTITASPSPGSAKWHLVAANIDLVRFVNRLPLLGSEHVVVETNIKPKKILPHWKFHVDLVNGGHAGLRIGWYLRVARAKTV